MVDYTGQFDAGDVVSFDLTNLGASVPYTADLASLYGSSFWSYLSRWFPSTMTTPPQTELYLPTRQKLSAAELKTLALGIRPTFFHPHSGRTMTVPRPLAEAKEVKKEVKAKAGPTSTPPLADSRPLAVAARAPSGPPGYVLVRKAGPPVSDAL